MDPKSEEFMSFKHERTLRFGLIPRKEDVHWKEVHWFDTKTPLALVHMLNAWEDGESA